MKSLWNEIAADLRFGIENDGGNPLSRILGNRGFHALLCYRIGHRVSGTLFSPIGFILTRLCQILYGIDLDPKAKIAGGVIIYHGVGIVVGGGVTIEPSVILFHGVTIGIKRSGHRDGYPHIESGVIIGTGAALLGPIRIGANTYIGANTVVTQDIPASSVVRSTRPVVEPRDPTRQSVGLHTR
jgi:serine O-acetyltransferase